MGKRSSAKNLGDSAEIFGKESWIHEKFRILGEKVIEKGRKIVLFPKYFISKPSCNYWKQVLLTGGKNASPSKDPRQYSDPDSPSFSAISFWTRQGQKQVLQHRPASPQQSQNPCCHSAFNRCVKNINYLRQNDYG